MIYIFKSQITFFRICLSSRRRIFKCISIWRLARAIYNGSLFLIKIMELSCHFRISAIEKIKKIVGIEHFLIKINYDIFYHFYTDKSLKNTVWIGLYKLIFTWNLKSQFNFHFVIDVISTVGPRGEHPDVLKEAYSNSLQIMLDNSLRSIVIIHTEGRKELWNRKTTVGLKL